MPEQTVVTLHHRRGHIGRDREVLHPIGGLERSEVEQLRLVDIGGRRDVRVRHEDEIGVLDRRDLEVLEDDALLDTGLRLSELAGLRIGDLLPDGYLRVRGKGGKEPLVPLAMARRSSL